MSSLPPVSGRAAVRAFDRAGWRLVRQRGSHMILEKPGAHYHRSIPNHRKVSLKVLQRELKKAGLTREEFSELLRG